MMNYMNAVGVNVRIVGIVVGVIIFLVLTLGATPRRRLNEKERRIIKENGLIHITNQKNKSAIMKGKELISCEYLFLPTLGAVCWMYINNPKTNNKRIRKQKKIDGEYTELEDRKVLKIEQVSDDQIDEMRIRDGFLSAIIFKKDYALIYKGNMNLKSNRIS